MLVLADDGSRIDKIIHYLYNMVNLVQGARFEIFEHNNISSSYYYFWVLSVYLGTKETNKKKKKSYKRENAHQQIKLLIS